MINFDNVIGENKAKDTLNWQHIPDHPYRILIIVGSRSEKINVVLNFFSHQPNINEIYLHFEDIFEAKYQFLITKRGKVGLKNYNDPRVFLEHSNDMRDVYKNINEHNPGKLLISFDDETVDINIIKKLHPIITKLFIRGKKLNILLVFVTQSYFKLPKNVRLNSTHYFIMKIPNKRELQQIAINHS